MALVSTVRADLKKRYQQRKVGDNEEQGVDLGSKDSISTFNDETVDLDDLSPETCPACNSFELLNRKLKRQQEDLSKKIYLHKQLEHKTSKSHSSPKSQPEIQPGNRLADVAGDANEFRIRSLCDRLPILKDHFVPIDPPKPLIKRLKGELAKSVGRKIDGCNMNILNPSSDEPF